LFVSGDPAARSSQHTRPATAAAAAAEPHLISVEADEPVQVAVCEWVHASTHTSAVDLPDGVLVNWQVTRKLGKAPAAAHEHIRLV
jgi:hypothetical protein